MQVTVILFCYTSIVKVVCHHEHALRGAYILNRSSNHLHQRCPDHRQSVDPADGLSTAMAGVVANGSQREHACAARKAAGGGKGASRRRRRRVEMQVTRLVVIITFSFFMAWLPFAVVALIGVFGDASAITPLVSVLPGMLAKASTIINPLLYAIGHPQYRHLISRRCCGRRRGFTGRGAATAAGAGAAVAAGRREGKGYRSKVYLQPTTRGLLSSVYYATVLRETDNGVGAGGPGPEAYLQQQQQQVREAGRTGDGSSSLV